MKKLTVKDIEVPEFLIQAFQDSRKSRGLSGLGWDMLTIDLAAVLLALTEQPIVPSEKQVDDLVPFFPSASRSGTFAHWVATEWPRRMFLKPQPELPGEVKALMSNGEPYHHSFANSVANKAIIAAYELGKKAGAR